MAAYIFISYVFGITYWPSHKEISGIEAVVCWILSPVTIPLALGIQINE